MTTIGMPRLTLRTPSPRGISNLTSISSALMSEVASSTPAGLDLNSSFRIIIRLPLSSSWGSSYVWACLWIFYFIFSCFPTSILGSIANRVLLRADSHVRRLFIISIVSSKSRQMTAAVLSRLFGESTASTNSHLSLSCTLQILSFGKLSSVVTVDVAISGSSKSFT